MLALARLKEADWRLNLVQRSEWRLLAFLWWWPFTRLYVAKTDIDGVLIWKALELQCRWPPQRWDIGYMSVEKLEQWAREAMVP